MISDVSTELYRPGRSVLPYAGMILLTFGIVLLIFGGMIDGAARRPLGPILSTVTIPSGIGLIIFGGMISKHAKRVESERKREWQSALSQPRAGATSHSCTRCKSASPGGAVFCRNCGVRL